MTLGSELVLQTVDRLATETVTPVDQMHYDETQLHPAPKIFKEDCRIDWNQPGRRIIDFIRGLSPYPAAWASMYKGERECNTLKIFRAHYDEQQLSDVQPGEIVTDGRICLAVACADGTIYIDELQIAGKRRLAVHDLLLGMRDIADYTLR
jgi:methionyl-tRNA formyltransferase